MHSPQPDQLQVTKDKSVPHLSIYH